MNVITLGHRKIGEGHPCFIVAELSCNHMQDLDIALQIARAAAEAGADALKIQTYRPDTITMCSDAKWFQIDCGTVWDGQTLHDLYSKTYTPWEWFPILKQECERLGLICFSSPFDNSSIDFLESHDNPCYKIASFEVCDHMLLERVARTGKPIILSSGVSDAIELGEAVRCLKTHGTKEMAILKCTSAYPASIEDANLMTIKDIRERFGVIAGLSDHTMGHEVPITAVCLGAKIVEKHLKLNPKTESADDAFSLTPFEFKAMVSAIRNAERAMGIVKYKKDGQSLKNFKFKRSLFWDCSLAEGDTVKSESFRSVRPSAGLHTKYHTLLPGLRLRTDILRCTPIQWKDFIVPSPIFQCRLATQDRADCKMIYEWRNDPVTCQMSHNTQKKEWESFQEEYKTYFQNYPIIVEFVKGDDKSALGLVSFISRESEGVSSVYTIGLNLNPAFRGEGLGIPVLSSALHYFREIIKSTSLDKVKIMAEIKDFNIASIKTFTRVGFLLHSSYKKLEENVSDYQFEL